MQQISEITEKISDAQFEAKLETLTMKYGGATLTPESFSQLQDELNEQIESAVADTDKSFEATVSQYKIMLGEGEIDDETYQAWIKTAKEEYLENIGDIQLKANSFQVDTILSAYEDELGDLPQKLKQFIAEKGIRGEDVALGVDISDQLNEFLDSLNLESSTQMALASLYEKLEPSQEGLMALTAKYKEFGLQIPSQVQDAINEGIAASASIGTVANSGGSGGRLWDNVSDFLGAPDSEAMSHFKQVITSGVASSMNDIDTVPAANVLAETLKNDITSQLPPQVNRAMDKVADKGKNRLESQLKKGVTVDMPVTINAQYKINGKLPKIGSDGKIASNASGGIITKPTLSTFAEERPEAAIPIEPTPNSINLWKETGRLLGVYKDEPSAPVLNYNGNDSVLAVATSSEKTVTIRLEGIGSITVDTANAEQSEEKILDFLTSNIVPVLKSVLTQELYEEGNGSYEF